ncbi:MAG: hypothetical protein KDD58_06800 [Bdellovibrionales bacterium]|nr:hypothetical protein [Bdellovibrionales bacterium]
MKKISEKVFCAFCKLPRHFYNKKHIDWTNVALSSFCSVVLMFAIWQGFDARIMILFVMCLMVAESFVQIRWRLSVVCPHCNFDPVTYIKDPHLACEKVKKKLESRVESGDYLLSNNNPFKNLPKRKLPSPTSPPSLSKHV